MSSRRLRSRSHSVDSRAGSVDGNVDENSLTDFSQEGGIMTGEIREPEVTHPTQILEIRTMKTPPLIKIPMINRITFPEISCKISLTM